jgi:hypothetical protein
MNAQLAVLLLAVVIGAATLISGSRRYLRREPNGAALGIGATLTVALAILGSTDLPNRLADHLNGWIG